MTYKVRQLAPDLPNTALGFLTFVGLLVAMVVQPVVGVLSDRTTSRLGRRLPFIIGGAVLVAIALFLLALSPALWVLVLGIIFIQFSSNLLQGPWQALIPDLVPEAQRGVASALKAMMDILAFVVGSAAAGVLMGQTETWGQAAVFLTAAAPSVIFIIAVTITAIWARENPPAGGVAAPAQGGGVSSETLAALKNAFSVDFRQHPVFGWWFANRILFWGGFIALNTFLINYLIDVAGMPQAEAQSFKGLLSIVIGASLLVVALPAGRFSDRIGRKPIVLAAGLLACLGASLLFLAHDQTMIAIAAAVIGVSVGGFLTTSWALATDIVPREEAARYLGIANIATCIGSGGARLLGGVLIDPINAAFASPSAGYLALYGLAALFFLFSALVVIPLPRTK